MGDACVQVSAELVTTLCMCFNGIMIMSLVYVAFFMSPGEEHHGWPRWLLFLFYMIVLAIVNYVAFFGQAPSPEACSQIINP